MIVKVVSDLHIDINNTILSVNQFGFMNELLNNKIDVLLIAGDTSGTYCLTNKYMAGLREFVKQNNLKTKVFFITGNHEPYNYDLEDKTIQEINSELDINFIDEPVKFLHNTHIVLGDYVIFGGTLYTDFNLKEDVSFGEMMASRYINDFRYCAVKDKDGIFRAIKPRDYRTWFDNCITELKLVCEKYNDKNIIVFTHFGNSEKSIAQNYVDSYVNSFYASNLEGFIEKYNNICLWAHGHVHNSFDYNIGNTRVVVSPYGYYGREQELLPEDYFGINVEV